MLKYLIILGIAFILATQSNAAFPAFEPHNRLAAPFSPNATIYRPDCWIKEDPLCDNGQRP